MPRRAFCEERAAWAWPARTDGRPAVESSQPNAAVLRCARVGAARVASQRGAILRRMPGLESDVLEIFPEPPRKTPRPFFHLWATWLSSVVVAALVGYLFVLSSGDPLDHLHWPEDSLERLASRDMEVRAAVARTSPWERRLYRFLLGDDESTEDWIGWHEELAQESSSPDVELDRLILLGEAGRSTAVREGVDEWEPDDETAAKRKEWVTAAYLAPPLNRAAARTLIGEVRDELP